MALEEGIYFFDTSNMYNAGRSEEAMGKGLQVLGARDQVVLASKVYYPTPSGGPNDRGAGRGHIIHELEAQLRRLQTDWIDLYYLHRPDFDTPLEETISVLDDCVATGKIRYWGMSTFPAWRMAEAWWRCDRRGWAPPICDQAPYNLLDRRLENERLPFLREYGLGVMTWSSLAGGLLSGKYATDARDAPPAGTRLADLQVRYRSRLGSSALIKAQQLATVARDAGMTPIELAIGWQLHQPGVTAAVIGPRTKDQLGSYLKAAQVAFPDGLGTTIDEIVPPGTAFADFHDTSGWYVGALNG